MIRGSDGHPCAQVRRCTQRRTEAWLADRFQSTTTTIKGEIETCLVEGKGL